MAHLSGFDHIRHDLQLLGNGGAVVFLCNVITGRTEHRYITVRPMDLVEVDVVGLQPFKAVVYRSGNVFPVDVRAVADPGKTARGSGNLGGDDQLIAALVFQPGADITPGAPLRFGARRNRIHFGGIDEVHSARYRQIELRVGIRFAVLFAECHRTEAQCRHFQIAGTQLPVFHIHSFKISATILIQMEYLVFGFTVLAFAA